MPKDVTAVQALTTVNLSFPYSGLTIPPSPDLSVDLIQRYNMHDVAVVDAPNLVVPSIRQQLAYGSPVAFSWSSFNGSAAFVGYVHSAEPYVATNGNGTRITLVSAGMPLKRPTQKMWTNVSASDVAAALAAQYGLQADIEPHPRVFPQIPQMGISDWELLRDLASRVGYSLRVEGVTLQFMSRARLARYYRSLAPKLSLTPADNYQVTDLRDVLEFRPVISTHQTEDCAVLANHIVGAIDAGTNSVVSARVAGTSTPSRGQATPVFDRFHTVEVARNSNEAQWIAQAQAENNRYPNTATARLFGNPMLAPNRAVNISGLPEGLDGYWTVLEAHHQISAGKSYEMDIVLGTEGYGAENFLPNSAQNNLTSMPEPGLLKVPYAAARIVEGQRSVASEAALFANGPRWTAG